MEELIAKLVHILEPVTLIGQPSKRTCMMLSILLIVRCSAGAISRAHTSAVGVAKPRHAPLMATTFP